ncbi:uncharacterized protein [Nicotiana sylvestris]|uniref:uncharacterized protein n=1 Tax=Nicotiana sylvestris TaxID=4096 RepID=UPI00388C83A3
MEILEENKCTLERQVRVLTSELAVEKALSNQAGKEKNLLETSFAEQLSKTSEEIRELKALLESSHASLQTSYDSALAENEKLKNEVADWERDYEILENKTAIKVSCAFLNSRHNILVEVSQENFNLESELAKIKETIEKTQQSQDFLSPMAEASSDVEDDMGTPIPSSQSEPGAAEDLALVPSSTPQ